MCLGFFFAELNSPLSRILFKDSDLKKMGRMDEFIKVIDTRRPGQIPRSLLS